MLSIAVGVARAKGRRWHKPWRELLSGAWLRAAHDSRRGVTDPRLLTCAAVRGMMDDTRNGVHGGTCRRDRKRGLVIPPVSLSRVIGEGGETAAELLPDRPRSDGNLLAVWAGYGDRRRGVCVVQRLYAYLHLVELWPQREIAATFGVHPSRVSQRIADFAAAVAAAGGDD